MSSEGNPVLESVYHAYDRLLSRVLGLQSGYIVILEALSASFKGHEALTKAFGQLDDSLKHVEVDSKGYFLSILFLDLITEVEIYLSSVVKAVITQYPRKLGATNFTLVEVMDARSIDDLTTRASDEFLNKLMYKKPSDYLDSICEILSIDKEPILPYWSSYVEAKARRDLGVHNGWICNATYLRKIHEAGLSADVQEGDLMVPQYDGYIDQLLGELRNISSSITTQVMEKYS